MILAFFDREPCSPVFVWWGRCVAGPAVLERREEVLAGAGAGWRVRPSCRVALVRGSALD